MKNPQYLDLWNRIQNFPIDNESAATRFSDKLADEQGWKPAYTQRAIEEYKRFMLLCCISETGAAPSKIVDEVWHLHLTYTQSYWTDFCKNTLGRDIHHFPSNGGAAEDQRHHEWYAETLILYHDTFGNQPPADIWPPAVLEGVTLNIPPRELRIEVIAGIIIALACPFVYIYLSYGVLSPFSLDGIHFLGFFPLYCGALILAYVLWRYLDNKAVAQIAAANFPDDVTPYQVAAFLYGRERAFQTALVDLMKKGVLEVREDQQFIVHSRGRQVQPGETNPLMADLVAEQDGSIHSYKSLNNTWVDRKKFNHPVLAALERYAFGMPVHVRDYILQIAFIAVAVIRIAQGVNHHKPVAYLILESAFLLIIFYFVVRTQSRRATVCKIIDALYLDRLKQRNPSVDLVVGEFALVGAPAISGFAEGVMLAGIFSAYPVNGYRNSWGWGSYYWGGGYGGCGSGGGGCGGGGCGGCGGN